MQTAIARVSKAVRTKAARTLDECATIARSHGLAWSTVQWMRLERGQISPTLPTLIGLCATLGEISGQPFGLPDLFATEDRIAINGDVTFPALKLRKILSGEPVTITISDLPADEVQRFKQELRAAISTAGWPASLAEIPAGRIHKVLSTFTEADERAIKSLGVSRLLSAAAMSELWKMSFSAMRDEIAKPGDNAQRRGRVARELKAELSEFIANA